MRTIEFVGGSAVRLVEQSIPIPGRDEVLIRVERSALCGSERSRLIEGGPVNAGHEAAGTVVKSPASAGLEPGQRVGISAVVGCGQCEACRQGVEVWCPNVLILDGMHSDYVVAPTRAVRRLAPETDAGTAVLLTGDALGVPVRGLRVAPSGSTTKVLVLGAGPVGLSHVLVRAWHHSHVFVVEPSAARRELALGLGAQLAVSPKEAADLPTVDLTIEASGRPESVDLAMHLTRRGGTILQSAEGASATVSPSRVMLKELTYVGSWSYASQDYPRMRTLLADGIPLDKLVTNVFPAEDAPTAYATFFAGQAGKILLDWT